MSSFQPYAPIEHCSELGHSLRGHPPFPRGDESAAGSPILLVPLTHAVHGSGCRSASPKSNVNTAMMRWQLRWHLRATARAAFKADMLTKPRRVRSSDPTCIDWPCFEGVDLDEQAVPNCSFNNDWVASQETPVGETCAQIAKIEGERGAAWRKLKKRREEQRKRSQSSTTHDDAQSFGKGEAMVIAEQVRASAADHLQQAWSGLQREFETQQLVWSSLSLLHRWEHDAKPHPEMELQAALQLSLGIAELNPADAAQALENALKLDEDGRLLNPPARLAARAVLKAERLANMRWQLAEHVAESMGDIEKGTVFSLNTRASVDQIELSELVNMCEFEDAELSSKIMKFLGLKGRAALGEINPTTKQPQKDEVHAKGHAKQKNSEKSVRKCRSQPHKRKSSTSRVAGSAVRRSGTHRDVQRRRRGGAPSSCSGQSWRSSSRSRRSGSRSHGSSRSQKSGNSSKGAKQSTSLAIALAELHNGTMRGTPALGREHGCIGTQQVEQAVPGCAEAEAAATAVKSLAAEELISAWEAFDQEFNTQTLIWNSLQLNNKAAPHLKLLRQRLQALIDASKHDRVGAVGTLQSLLQSDLKRKYLSNATKDAALRVITVGEVAKWRFGLVERLERATRENDVCVEEAELGDWLLQCNLGDLGLEYRIRRVLGLNLGNMCDFQPQMAQPCTHKEAAMLDDALAAQPTEDEGDIIISL